MIKFLKSTPVLRTGGGHGGRTLHKPIFEHEGKYYIKTDDGYEIFNYENEKYSEVEKLSDMWFVK